MKPEIPWIKDKNTSKGYTIISQLGYYNTKEWKKIRLLKLADKPLCEMCSQQNIVTPANTVDHIVPITLDNIELFFDFGNLQSLCAACHRIKTNLDMGKISRIKDGIELKKQMESD